MAVVPSTGVAGEQGWQWPPGAPAARGWDLGIVLPMAADPEPDPWEDPPARLPAPDDRLWRHPSELGGFTPAPVAAPSPDMGGMY